MSDRWTLLKPGTKEFDYIDWDSVISSFGKIGDDIDPPTDPILTIYFLFQNEDSHKSFDTNRWDQERFVAELMLVYDHSVFYIVPRDEQAEFFAWVLPTVEIAMRTNDIRREYNKPDEFKRQVIEEMKRIAIKIDSIAEAVGGPWPEVLAQELDRFGVGRTHQDEIDLSPIENQLDRIAEETTNINTKFETIANVGGFAKVAEDAAAKAEKLEAQAAENKKAAKLLRKAQRDSKPKVSPTVDKAALKEAGLPEDLLDEETA